jgi:Uma2 family endonuclease
MKTLHWTSRDLELLPDDGNRYEIIDGELYVAKQPDWQHQLVCSQLVILLGVWNRENTMLTLKRTLEGSDTLESPFLPGFHCQVSRIFKHLFT